MVLKKSEMSWVVVADLKKALEYFTKVLGLTVLDYQPEYNWAELSGSEKGGAFLGLAQASEYDPDSKPGQNAIMTFTVDDFETSKSELVEKGAKFIGEVLEVPGQVKMQTLVDIDNNRFQIVQDLKTK
jgi:predicted enzyme related to lactoylglutathione lyase